VVGTWIEALNAMGADPDEDDLNYDDQWYFDRMGEDDGLRLIVAHRLTRYESGSRFSKVEHYGILANKACQW
jgi:hypothetical protein